MGAGLHPGCLWQVGLLLAAVVLLCSLWQVLLLLLADRLRARAKSCWAPCVHVFAGLQGAAGVGESQETVQRGLLILQAIFVQGVDRVLLRWVRVKGRWLL